MPDRMRPILLLSAMVLALPTAAFAQPQTLTLAEAVTMAAKSTPGVQIAGLRADQAKARVAMARGNLLPSLGGSASEYNRTINSRTFGFSFPAGAGPVIPDLLGPFDVVDARLEARQTLFDAASWVRLRAEREGLDASEADQGTSAERAAQAAATAYLRVARADALVEARRADLDLADALVQIADAQVQAGVTAPIDATRARSQLAASKGALVVAENRRNQAGIALARVLGLDPAAAPAVGDTLGEGIGLSSAPLDSAEAVTMALERRPELLAEQARRRKAASDRTAISVERLPRVDVVADYGLSGTTPSDAITTRQVGVALSVPLFDGLRREARIGEQTAALQESDVRLRDLRLQIVADVQAARLDLASAREQQSVATEQLELAEKELAQARERFEQGVAGNIEVINAQASLVRARDAEIDARFAAAASRVSLAHATGVARTLH